MKLLTLSALLVVATASSVAAQAPQPPPTYEAAVLRTWKALHDKILVMAKDTQFPDAKLGWKPHPDSRSVLDEPTHTSRRPSPVGDGGGYFATSTTFFSDVTRRPSSFRSVTVSVGIFTSKIFSCIPIDSMR